MRPVSATHRFGLLAFGLACSSLSFLCWNPSCACARVSLCLALHCPAELWLGPMAWEGSSRRGHGKQSGALNGFQGGRAVRFSGGREPGLPPLRVSLAGFGDHSNPSPGVCTREGYRDPAANGSAESLGGRGRRFSCCSWFRFFLPN